MKKIIMLAFLAGSFLFSYKTAIAAEAIFIEKYEQAVETKDTNVLVIFGTEWCGYCHKLEKDIKSMNLDDYVICVVDSEKREDLRKKYDLKSYPTSLIIRNNLETTRKQGYEKKNYRAWLDSNRKPSGEKDCNCGPECKCKPDQGPACKCKPDCSCGQTKENK